MNIASTALAGLAALTLGVGPAAAWSCRPLEPLTLSEGWAAQFRSEFEEAGEVYLVTTPDAGPPRGWGMPCDYRRGPPPPPERKLFGNRKALQEYSAAKRAAEILDEACDPAEWVRFSVTETLKGAPRSGWVETQALLTLRSGPPQEPFETGGFARHVGAADGGCGRRSRRVSPEAAYVVFGTTLAADTPQEPPRFHISRVYLADASTPFLAEARKLAGETAAAVAGVEPSPSNGR